ncbi:hypothetical protein [Bradyrhizobium japonicum]|uniref:hypothetical protein n=1 Tax=Bradyrhizobium japonicum TaxID=375 RepID=UPI0004AEAEF2|nr:hypothetical protein [Bradyrhizobium japonicum]
MRSLPSIVPADRLDRDIYLVLEDFGARAGCAWRETDEADTDLEGVLRNLLSLEPSRSRWNENRHALSLS